MRLDVNKIVTLGNREKYLIVEKVIVENETYLYIAELNKAESDILDNYKIVKVTSNQDKIYLDEIIGEEKLKKILPSFVESLSN
jgi:Icc-related predicted phosphoesterase